MKLFFKTIASLLLVVLIGFVGMNFSPIYRFATPTPFSGEKIYNPYATLDTSIGWSRANFHTHTKVDKGINECPEYPDEVLKDYMKYDYDILTFSNHNALTTFPGDSTRQIWVYEHGYSPFKFHKLVFGSRKVLWFDNPLPIITSQNQFQLDLLARDADFLVFNHPDRTLGITKYDMERLTGYRMIEAYSGKETGMKHWDEALSAGHYSYCLINDDCHDSDNLRKIAIRCSWLNTSAHDYESVKNVLLSGCFYTMSIPDWSSSDDTTATYEALLSNKIANNLNLPQITDISLCDDTISLTLSKIPVYIKVIGQNGALLDSIPSKADAQYIIRSNDNYARLEAVFSSGVKIYTNAFARTSNQEDLFAATPHPIRWGLTIAYNMLLLLIIIALGWLIFQNYTYLRRPNDI